ncbi:NUDIX hydrolase [Schaalia sp. lx-100]|uniref:NUDIX hydrolase n=1 Tax=Schaalia sp. lx-100 TaxID=2899081 RepID=UPI001E54375A|nr:NUDIX domain-containing protein [Schaalia sp. lx-100]MCD4557094.1 NUDIX domain-containing protein [Schaalia sp. lx-100]
MAQEEIENSLGPQWPVDADGYPHRSAARVILFNSDGHVLLVHGHDAIDPSHHWWFTVGGGVETGETPQQAAVRELYEETGIRIEIEDLIGPVLYRQGQFEFLSVTARQDEWFFLAHTKDTKVSSRGWTELEQNVLDGHRWWNIDEVDALAESVMVTPSGLADLLRKWKEGWDGECLHRNEYSD